MIAILVQIQIYVFFESEEEMIVKTKEYGGKCSCGSIHDVYTELCVIEAGCLGRINEYLMQYGLSGYCTAVYDTNTYNAKGLIRPGADQEVILSAYNLHADDQNVEIAMNRIADQAEFLIAVGSGTIHDITRYCAYKKGIPFVSCPTAASVDGFCSSVAAMTWQGHKKTITAVAPKIVLADMNVIAQAPMRLTRSGFGDMVGKYIALSDWKVARILTQEYYCSKISTMMEEALNTVVENFQGIVKGNAFAYEKLTYGLLLSGIAMQLIGNSRPASGAEHHISHIIEMEPAGLAIHSDALHGEKVGVGTILISREYHRLAETKAIQWNDYSEIDSELVLKLFGSQVGETVLQENQKDSLAEVTAETIETHWEEICNIISEIPQTEELLKIYRQIGAKESLTDIGVSEEILPELLNYSPYVRNRLTLMRVRRLLNA